MSDDVIAITPTITAGGLAAARDAKNGGFRIGVSHVGFGDAAGYRPSRDQTALKNEVLRVQVGGGQDLGESAVSLSTVLGPGSPFPIREVGFYTGPTLFAVWSDAIELCDRPSRASLILAFNLYLVGIPPNVVTVSTAGMNLNIFMAEPLTDYALAITQLQHRVLTQEVRTYVPLIQAINS